MGRKTSITRLNAIAEQLQAKKEEEELETEALSIIPDEPAPVTSIFDGIDDLAPEPEISPLPTDIPPMDEGLTEDEKAEFVRLLKEYMPVDHRAKQLVKLANFTDQKRAGVALRAIEEINRLTGLSEDKTDTAPTMFALPQGTTVSVAITKVAK